LLRDLLQPTWLDGIHLDLAFFHALTAANLHMRASPDADAARVSGRHWLPNYLNISGSIASVTKTVDMKLKDETLAVRLVSSGITVRNTST
jgi:hypothetical protein